MSRAGLVAAIALVAVGCASTPPPFWEQPGSYVRRAGQPAFIGVGSIKEKNVGLAQSTAANRARAELTKSFEVFAATVMKDYFDSLPPDHDLALSMHVGLHIKTFCAVTLSSIEIIEVQKDEETGMTYALAALPLSAFYEAMARMQDLDPVILDYARQHGERVWSDLLAEEQARR